jgi:hypothetical protein
MGGSLDRPNRPAGVFHIVGGANRYYNSTFTNRERVAYDEAYYFLTVPRPDLFRFQAQDQGVPKVIQHRIEQELDSVLYSARDETFEDGMESEFSQNLVRFIYQYKNLALDCLEKRMESKDANPEVLSEALRWLPRIDDQATYKQRLNLISRCLFLPWARVRDAAVLALSSLADDAAVKPLKKAIEREEIAELRADMIDALLYIEAASRAVSS